MECDQDLCLNFWYDFKKSLWQDELNPRVRCAFGNVYIHYVMYIQPLSNPYDIHSELALTERGL